MSYIAIHRIDRLNKDKKPETVKPGQPFTPNSEQERKEMLALGAIREFADVRAEEKAEEAKPNQKAGKASDKAAAKDNGKNDDDL